LSHSFIKTYVFEYLALFKIKNKKNKNKKKQKKEESTLLSKEIFSIIINRIRSTLIQLRNAVMAIALLN
jgi:hypothetical protein